MDRAIAAGLFLAGWCSYEFGYALEERLRPLAPKQDAVPLLWLGSFKEARRLDRSCLDAFWSARSAPAPLRDIALGWDKDEHGRRVRRVRDALHAGDVYQVNLTFPIRFRFEGDPLDLHAALRAAQPAAHGGLVVTDAVSLLSVSPELFVHTEGGRATARPMKGTAARGGTEAADLAAMQALRADPKQRAENLMIVDLLRNDLSRL